MDRVERGTGPESLRGSHVTEEDTTDGSRVPSPRVMTAVMIVSGLVHGLLLFTWRCRWSGVCIGTRFEDFQDEDSGGLTVDCRRRQGSHPRGYLDV